MSQSYLVGFQSKPEIADLDARMGSWGFTIDLAKEEKFTRLYRKDLPDSPSIFFYYQHEPDLDDVAPFRDTTVLATGELKTAMSLAEPKSAAEIEEIVRVEGVSTEYDWCRHVTPERLPFYEAALALQQFPGAVVIDAQNFEILDKDREIS